MKTVFIVNPKAGKGKKEKQLIEKICTRIALGDVNWEWYLTKSPGDAVRFVKEYCKTNGAARFIACGGDGTFSEVVNGVADVPDAEVGVIPIGSGNDFCRNFQKDTDFFDLQLQSKASTVACDVVGYVTELDGVKQQGICANMFNIGFDCKVADKTNDLKSNTIFGGSFSYVLAILWELIRKNTTSLQIFIDGIPKIDGELLLCSIANGKYCGGGVMSNPLAAVTDGKLNVNLVQNVSRLRFLSLLPSYMKGTHLLKKGIERILQTLDCETLTVTPHEGRMRLCIDGEIITAGVTTFTVIPEGIRFVVPKINDRP